MTQPHESDKLPASTTPPMAPEHHPAVPPAPANFAPQPPPTHPYADPRAAQPPFTQPRFTQPRPVHPQPQVPPVMPIVNVTQNNMGGGFVTVRRGPNHGLHLVLTILTCGMWAPVWILVWIIDAMGRRG